MSILYDIYSVIIMKKCIAVIILLRGMFVAACYHGKQIKQTFRTFCHTANSTNRYVQLLNGIHRLLNASLFLKMSGDLLAKEKELYRLNKEIEEKNRDLMKELNNVLSSNVVSSNFQIHTTHSDNLAENIVGKNEIFKQTSGTIIQYDLPRCTSNQNLASSLKKETITVVDDSINNSNKKNSTANKAINHFLKTKIELLQTELQTTQLEYKKKADYCKQLEMDNKHLESDKTRLCHQVGSLKDTIVKLENKNNHLQRQYELLTSENLHLRKDIDDVKKNAKTVNHQFHSYEVRLNKALEDNEKMRSALKSSEEEEKELRNHIKKLEHSQKLSNKNLEKQRSELLQAFQKQMLLVENLKKQKACLLLTKQVEMYEADFNKLLECNDLDLVN